MQTSQFEKLIQAVTGRPLLLSLTSEEIPLSGTVAVLRPHKPGTTAEAYEWKTPSKEDSLLRSFLTAFCSRYLEPDPASYTDWAKHADEWEDARWHCSLWGHHRSYKVSPEKLRSQIIANFSGFDAVSARLGFYPTLYGIGIFTFYGGAWAKNALTEMAGYLRSQSIPFKMEMSDAGWVTRFVIGLDKETHRGLLDASQRN
jgi:hypothetical protein